MYFSNEDDALEAMCETWDDLIDKLENNCDSEDYEFHDWFLTPYFMELSIHTYSIDNVKVKEK